ncbi:MAG TPA: alpha/beta hydrolase, partial [Anaerolineales bacterium]
DQKPKRGFTLWLKRILTGLLVLLGVLAVAGMAYQYFATQADKKKYPAPGQLVDVGGYRLHIYCTGAQIDGSPTVILEQGLGGPSPAWAWIQPEIAKVTRVCAYDRAGVGWSDPAPKGTKRDGLQIARELQTLLQKANIPGPYVIAGHSLGGLYALVYAHQYPEDVAGLVLLDSSSPDQWTHSPSAQELFTKTGRQISMYSILAHFGLVRLFMNSQPPSGLPEPHNGELTAFTSANKDWDTQVGEYGATLELDNEVRTAGKLGDLPLAVLTATIHNGSPEMEQAWPALQDELAQLSTNSIHYILEGARHESLWVDPKFAAQSTSAILKVVDAAQHGTPLQK